MPFGGDASATEPETQRGYRAAKQCKARLHNMLRPMYYGPKMTQSSTPAAAVATAAPPKCASTNLASMRAVGTGLS